MLYVGEGEDEFVSIECEVEERVSRTFNAAMAKLHNSTVSFTRGSALLIGGAREAPRLGPAGG